MSKNDGGATRHHPGSLAEDILSLAAWFGLVTGLSEGVLFLAFQTLGQMRHVTLEIIWISALFDVLLYSGLGFAFFMLARLLPKLPMTLLSVFVFALLTLSDWLALALAEKIHLIAIVLLALGGAVQFTRWFGKHQTTALHFWHRSLPWVAAVALLTFVGIQGGLWLRERLALAGLPAAPVGSPNILLIMVDALRADHLSGYGYQRRTSPNIDGIAQQGVLFEHAFATTSYTLPSHASLLTGRYPYEHGVEWKTSRALLDGSHLTLADALHSRGYRTAAVSANVFWFTRPRGFGRGFIRFEDYFHSIGDMAVRTLYGRAFEHLVLRRLGFEDIPARKRAPDVNRSALSWIDRDRTRPFFIFLNYMDVHDPYLPPQPFRNKFSPVKYPGGILNWRTGRSDPQLTPEQLQSEIDAYDGAIAYVDDHIGQLLAELQRRGLGNNTAVVITSDHGESFGEHGLYLHGNSLYREEIHVPLIFWAPTQIPAGRRLALPVTNAAIPATVMDLVSTGDQMLFPGLPLATLWQTPEAPHDSSHPLAEIAQIPWAPEKAPTHHGSMKSLVSPQWHYIIHEKLGTQFYNRQDDHQELHNLAENQEKQDDLAVLRWQLQQLLSDGQRTAGRAP
jgi:arylsulfatase A-like enzyme